MKDVQSEFNIDTAFLLASPPSLFQRHHGINSVMDCPADLVWSQKECHCMHDVDAIRPMEPTGNFYSIGKRNVVAHWKCARLEIEGSLDRTYQRHCFVS